MEWILKKDLCTINTTDHTHLAPTGNASLLDLSIYSSDLLTFTVLTVEEYSWSSDNFPISITVDGCDPETAAYEYFK